MALRGGQYELQIVLPDGLSREDEDRLKRCSGKIIFVPVIRKRVFLHEVDHKSYFRGGQAPDYLCLLMDFRRRFPVLITGVGKREIYCVALSLGYPRGLAVQNTGPFEFSNGDLLCLVPPLPCCPQTLTLASCGSELIFPLVMPVEAASDIIGKIMAGLAYEFCARNQIPAPRPVDTYRVVYRGRTIDLAPPLTDGTQLQEVMKTLFASMMFSIHEGVMVVLALMPNLLAGGASSPFINSLVQLQSATRLSVQLFNPPAANLPDPGRSPSRNNVFEMLSAWLAMSTQIGELLSLKPALKVCLYHADSSKVKEKDTCTVIVP